MTTPSKPDDQRASVDEDARQRCMQYLLGELSDDQATDFEHELGRSKALQAELLAQSDVICGVAVAATPTLVTTHSVWPRVAAMVALAACLMIAFVNWPAKQEDPNEPTIAAAQPEGLLIAQAWADVSFTGAPLGAPVEPDNFFEPETESDDDSSLSWMVAAVKAGAASDG